MPVCAICTATVATCVGLSRWLGVDDTISGVWIGGLMVSAIFWLLNFLDQKKIYFKFQRILVTCSFYFFIIYPLFLFDIIGHPLNKYKYFGVDKLVFGITAGSLMFLLSFYMNDFLKRQNQGKAFFPFQKVIIPVSFLLILSLIFYKTC